MHGRTEGAAIGLTALLLVGLALGACREAGPDAERFRLDGKLFVFNYREATATYLVNLAPNRPMEAGQTAVVSFEDPAGGPPIVVRRKIWPFQTRTTIESPPLSCVVKDRPYAVAIAIEDATGATAQEIRLTMTSSEDQDILPDLPLVVGPGYDANPALAGHPGGKLPGKKAPCPSRSG